jgi:hypothetical protein
MHIEEGISLRETYSLVNVLVIWIEKRKLKSSTGLVSLKLKSKFLSLRMKEREWQPWSYIEGSYIPGHFWAGGVAPIYISELRIPAARKGFGYWWVH